MNPKETAKMRTRIPITRMETVNKYTNLETNSKKLINDIIYARIDLQSNPILRQSGI